MQQGSKRISPNSRGRILTLKKAFMYSKNPFDGNGHIFKTAISELRKEGVKIIYDRKKCRYYNADTISEIWGYSQPLCTNSN